MLRLDERDDVWPIAERIRIRGGGADAGRLKRPQDDGPLFWRYQHGKAGVRSFGSREERDGLDIRHVAQSFAQRRCVMSARGSQFGKSHVEGPSDARERMAVARDRVGVIVDRAAQTKEG